MIKARKLFIQSCRTEKYGKARHFIFPAVIIAGLLIAALFLSSCFSASTQMQQEDQRVTDETAESSAAEISEEMSEDTIITAEEPPELLDYGNLETDAEMTGYIPSFLCTERDNYIRIDITNNSDYPWRNKRPGMVRIGYHYYGQDVDFVDYDKTSRTELPDTVEPGQTVSVNVLINDIVNDGYYIIQIDPVIEGNELPEDNFWFSSKGVKMIEGLTYFSSCDQ